MQSHSCEILYETCLDGVIFPAIYSTVFRIATCFVFLDGIIEKSPASLKTPQIHLRQAPLKYRRDIVNYYEMIEMMVLRERTFKECSLDI